MIQHDAKCEIRGSRARARQLPEFRNACTQRRERAAGLFHLTERGRDQFHAHHAETLDFLFRAFNAKFVQGFDGAKSHALDVAFKATSSTSEEVYPFLGQWPQLREWVGDRILNSLVLHGFTIKNAKFESTVEVPRDRIEDDRYGVFAPMFQQLGVTTRLHPDKLVFPLLNGGFAAPCYDGQNFFDPDHPVQDADGNDAVVSNMQDGAGPAWFLLDTTQALPADLAGAHPL